MKYLVIFSLILVLATPLLAEEAFFKDVPEGHWATAAVYQLVKMGVTKGYPDGTFRGKKDISRYEIAVFLAKFANYFNKRGTVDTKLIEELRAETALLKYKRDEIAKQETVKGEFMARGRASSIAPRGAKLDYRLKLSLLKKFSEDSTLRFRLDTVDAGYNTSSARDFATRLIDIESRFKLGGWNYKVNLGPGVVVHTEDNDFFPSENYTIYIRPKTAVTASKQINKMNVAASYVTRQVETSGKIGVHELTSNIKYKYGQLAVNFRPRYMFIVDGQHDYLAEAGMNYMFNKHLILYTLLGVGDFQAGNSGMYLKVIKKVLDPWGTGTNFVFRFDKIGTKYRTDPIDKYEFVYLNNFDRLILDGTADLGVKIDQKINKELSAQWKCDYVTDSGFNYGAAYPETYFLWQLTLNYQLATGIGFNTFYKSYNVPSGVAQFSQTVPTVSEIFGCGLNYAF